MVRVNYNVNKRRSILVAVLLGAFVLASSCHLQAQRRTGFKGKICAYQAGATTIDTMQLLVTLADEAVRSDSVFLGKPRFVIQQEEGKYSYNATPFALDQVLSRSDPLAVPMEALIRVEVLRRDFKAAVPTEPFWITPLISVTKQIQQCVDRYDRLAAKSSANAAMHDCSPPIEQSYENLSRALHTYASEHNLLLVQDFDQRGPATGYNTKVQIEPPKATVKIMTLLEYKKCTAAHASLDLEWIDLVAGESYMIGRYRYRAEWPAELNGAEEGEFEIKGPGTITFRPKGK